MERFGTAKVPLSSVPPSESNTIPYTGTAFGVRNPVSPRGAKKASRRILEGSPSTGMVGHTGFEPVTSGSGDQRSIQAELMPPLNCGKRSGFLVAISSATFLALVSRDLVALSFSSAGQVILLLVKLSMARVQTAYSPVRPARNSLEGLKTGAGRSGILTTSPVLGFRPIRGARVTTLNVPNPRISMCSPCCNAATTESRKPSTTAAVSDFGNPVASAI